MQNSHDGTASRSKKTPGPPALPVVGHLFEFATNPLPFLTHCVEKYGDVVALQVGRPTLLITNPDDIRHVLISDPNNFDKSHRLSGQQEKRALGGGLLTHNIGAAHLKRRRTLKSFFLRREVAQHGSIIARRASEAMRGWRSNQVINLSEEMVDLSLGILVDLLFGPHRSDRDQLCNTISLLRAPFERQVSSLFPWPRLVQRFKARPYRKANGVLQSAIQETIDAARQGDLPPNNLVAQLVTSQGPSTQSLSDDQVQGEVKTFIYAGYESVAAAISWSAYLLARHPSAQRELQVEVDTVCKGDPPDSQHFDNLRYTRAALAESMRLYPPIWMFVRVARGSDVLPSGAPVKAGTKLYLCPYLAQRNPQLFPNPETFSPQRFLDNSPPNPMGYFPFGRGAHKCIGEPLAELEATLILATLAQRWTLSPVDDGETEIKARMVLRSKHGHRLRLNERTKARP